MMRSGFKEGSYHSYEGPISPVVLGSLAMHGHGARVIDGAAVSTTYYPSPRATITLQEELDLKPGEDVFKPSHVLCQDFIRLKPYLAHIAQNEHPQSTGMHFFTHDRGEDHLVGVITAPKQFLDTVGAEARAQIQTRLRRARAVKAADAYDRGTSLIRKFAVGAVPYLGYDYNKKLFGLITLDEVKLGEEFDGDQPDRSYKIGSILFERLQELQPKIQKMQAALAAAEA